MHTPFLHRIVGCGLVLLLAAGCYQSNGSSLPPTDSSQIQPTFTLPPTMTLQSFPTNTPDPNVFVGAPTLSPEDLLAMQIAAQPTFDPLYLTVTAMQATMQAPPPLVVQPLDPIAITATFIVDSATQTAGAPMTLTAQASGIGFPTIAPTFDINAPANQVPLQPGADCVHEVRATDRNLYRIALNYGLTVDQIAAASGILNPDLIFVGQKLTIPGCGVTGAVPLATSTPRGGIAINTGAQTAGTPAPGMTFTPIPVANASSAGGSGQVHIVRQGETLFQISMQTGVPVADIAAVNGIQNINLIYLGQTLTIP